MNRFRPIISLVIPCYNESECLKQTVKSLVTKLNEWMVEDLISKKSYILFIDDGSTDDTWSLIEKSVDQSRLIRGLKLTRNKGHQNALVAGLLSVPDCDATISLDADLQDDLDTIREMIIQYIGGSDIVYGVRNQRETDTFIKKYFALSFYKLIKFLGVEIIYNHADFRLCSAKVLKNLERYQEANLFLRGIFPNMGYKSTKVFYGRMERVAGKPKYTFWKSLGLAINGITSFSVVPLRIATFIGLFTVSIAIVFISYIIFQKIFNGMAIQGWTSLMVSIYLIGGIILLVLGILGEYLGKIYLEVKSRPRYLVDQIIGVSSDEKRMTSFADGHIQDELDPKNAFSLS